MKSYIITFCFIIGTLFSFSVSAQSRAEKKRLQRENAEEKVLTRLLPEKTQKIIIKINKSLQNDIEELPKENKKELTKIFNERARFARKKLMYGHCLVEGDENKVNNYLQNILAEVYRANPQIAQENIRLLPTRYNVPNAVCMGEGTITFNIGLLRHLENESQIAFIVCHELAHYILDHVNKSIFAKVALLHSERIQKEVKKIKKNEFKRREKLEKLLKGFIYEDYRHSRSAESQADSFAFVLMTPTSYDRKEAISVLEILDKIDQQDIELDIKAIMHSDNYPFDDSWLRIEDLIKYNAKDNSWNTDSLKTHPACTERIADLHKITEKASSQAKILKNVQGDALFQKVKYQAEREVAGSDLFFENYGKALYTNMLLMGKYPEDAYFSAQAGKCLNLMYEAQKNHELGKYVRMPSDKQEPNYARVLTFIQNLRMSELGNLSFHFLKKYQTKFENNEEYLFTLLQNCKSQGKETELNTLKQKYQKLFPGGKYKAEVSEM